MADEEKRVIPFCEYVRIVSDNPETPTPRITIGYFLLLKKHVLKCNECMEKIEATLRNAPFSKFKNQFEEN